MHLTDRIRNGLGAVQSGDTIVEVMVVLAVLGMAMGVSYATANRSLLNTRQAQENSIATEIAQSQVEALTSLGCVSGDPACDPTNPANPSYQLFHWPTAFCIVNNALPPVTYTNGGCTKDSLYQIKINCLNSCIQPHVFEVEILWDDVLGQGKDTVIQDYTIPR